MSGRVFLVCLLLGCSWLRGSLSAAAAEEQVWAVRSVRVFRGAATEPLLENATVVVRGGRIAAVGPDESVAIPDGAAVLDGVGRTLLPGLFDLHVHLSGPATRFDRPVRGDAVLRAEQTVACGVTAVLDLNAPEAFIFGLRSAQRTGALPGLPRIFSCGAAITAPGGHGSESGFPGRTVTDVSGAAAEVAELAGRRPDVVKIMLDAGGWAGIPPLPCLSAEVVAALVAAAHEHGLKAVVHVVDADLVGVAVDAGADAIAHYPVVGDLDDRLIERIVRAQVAVIPTLAAYGAIVGVVDDPSYLDRELVDRFVDPRAVAGFRDEEWRRAQAETERVRAIRARWPDLLAGVSRLHQKGVRLLAGTDAGYPATFHGEALHRELTALVEAGLPNAEVLAMATLEAARFLGVADHVGSIAVGLEADLLLVEGNPLKRIGDLRNIVVVMRAGTVIDRDQVATRTRALAAPAGVEPAVAEPGPRRLALFDFDQGEDGIPAHEEVTDAGVRGLSTARVVAVVDYGEQNPTPFLRVSGEVVYRPPTGGFAGVLLKTDAAGKSRSDFGRFAGVRFRVRSNERREFRFQVVTEAVRDGDHFGVSFAATSEWRNVRVPFDILTQIGFGRRVRFDLSDVTGLEFRTASGAEGVFRLDVDDVELFR